MAAPQDDDRSTGRLALVAALGFVLFAPPLIATFDQGALVLGVPVIWVYLFVAWALVIGLIAATAGRSE
jgi:hypothetical protein